MAYFCRHRGEAQSHTAAYQQNRRSSFEEGNKVGERAEEQPLGSTEVATYARGGKYSTHSNFWGVLADIPSALIFVLSCALGGGQQQPATSRWLAKDLLA